MRRFHRAHERLPSDEKCARRPPEKLPRGAGCVNVKFYACRRRKIPAGRRARPAHLLASLLLYAKLFVQAQHVAVPALAENQTAVDIILRDGEVQIGNQIVGEVQAAVDAQFVGGEVQLQQIRHHI